MINYRVSFFKKTDDKDEFLGFVVVDDHKTNEQVTLLAKAFRHAAPVCLLADKTIIERVYNVK